jgi:hypothetical protein
MIVMKGGIRMARSLPKLSLKLSLIFFVRQKKANIINEFSGRESKSP